MPQPTEGAPNVPAAWQGSQIMDRCFRLGPATEKQTPPSGNGIIGGCGWHQTGVSAPWVHRPSVIKRENGRWRAIVCSVNQPSYGANARAVPVSKRTHQRNATAGVRHQTGMSVAAGRWQTDQTAGRPSANGDIGWGGP